VVEGTKDDDDEDEDEEVKETDESECENILYYVLSSRHSLGHKCDNCTVSRVAEIPKVAQEEQWIGTTRVRMVLWMQPACYAMQRLYVNIWLYLGTRALLLQTPLKSKWSKPKRGDG
jgi:hypothetical protein